MRVIDIGTIVWNARYIFDYFINPDDYDRFDMLVG